MACWGERGQTSGCKSACAAAAVPLPPSSFPLAPPPPSRAQAHTRCNKRHARRRGRAEQSSRRGRRPPPPPPDAYTWRRRPGKCSAAWRVSSLFCFGLSDFFSLFSLCVCVCGRSLTSLPSSGPSACRPYAPHCSVSVCGANMLQGKKRRERVAARLRVAVTQTPPCLPHTHTHTRTHTRALRVRPGRAPPPPLLCTRCATALHCTARSAAAAVALWRCRRRRSAFPPESVAALASFATIATLLPSLSLG